MVSSHILNDAGLACGNRVLSTGLLCDILLSHLLFECNSEIVKFDFSNPLPIFIRNSYLSLENGIRFLGFLTIQILVLNYSYS